MLLSSVTLTQPSCSRYVAKDIDLQQFQASSILLPSFSMCARDHSTHLPGWIPPYLLYSRSMCTGRNVFIGVQGWARSGHGNIAFAGKGADAYFPCQMQVCLSTWMQINTVPTRLALQSTLMNSLTSSKRWGNALQLILHSHHQKWISTKEVCCNLQGNYVYKTEIEKYKRELINSKRR